MKDPQDHLDDLRIPDELARELSSLYRADISVPPRVDQAVLNRARAEWAGRRRRTILLRVGSGAGIAAAATVAVVLWLQRPGGEPGRQVAVAPATAPLIAEDVNSDGRVDVLDALRLARRVEDGSAGTQWDVNRDGTVDRQDVDAVALAAVRLDAGGGLQ